MFIFWLLFCKRKTAIFIYIWYCFEGLGLERGVIGYIRWYSFGFLYGESFRNTQGHLFIKNQSI